MTAEELIEDGEQVLYMEFDTDRPGGASEISAYRLKGAFWVDAEFLDEPAGPFSSLEDGLHEEGILEVRETLQRVDSTLWSTSDLANRLIVSDLAKPGQVLKLNGESWIVTANSRLERI